MSIVASTTIITNLKNVATSTGNTLKSAGSEGVDMPGMLALALTKANELKACLTLLAQEPFGKASRRGHEQVNGYPQGTRRRSIRSPLGCGSAA